MLGLEDSVEPAHDFGMLCADVGAFAWILSQVVKLCSNRRCRVIRGNELLTNRLPVTDAHALLTAIGGKLAIEKSSFRLWPTAERRRETHSIDRLRDPVAGACKFK